MCRNASETGKQGQRGFTLAEAAIVVVLGLLISAIVFRFYRDSYRNYSLQEQIEERNQNANFTLSKMVEVLQQAGSGLPDTGWNVLKYSGGVLTVASNPCGMIQFGGNNPSSSKFVALDDVSQLRKSSQPLFNATHILVNSEAAAKLVKFTIDSTYNTGGFTKGIKDNAKGKDSIYLTANLNLGTGDWVYAYREDQFLLVSDSLVIRPNGNASAQIVLAENIDSLGFTFLNAAGAATTTWSTMRSARITVRARTAKPDPRLKKPGFPGYRFITLPMNVILRNKV